MSNRFCPRFLGLSLAALALSSPAVCAKQQVKAEATEVFVVPDVVVDGAAVDAAAYARLRKAVEAFDENRRLAPASTPKFLLAAVAAPSGAPLSLNLNTDTRSTQVKIDGSGLFALPSLGEAEAETARLVLNQLAGAYKWTPYVRSPNLPKHHLRFGDLRLECAMRWAFLQDTFDLAKRTLLQSIGGPCHSALVRVRYDSPRPLAGIVLIEGDRREPLDAERIGRDGHVFFPPIHQSEWGDDALLELQFR